MAASFSSFIAGGGGAPNLEISREAFHKSYRKTGENEVFEGEGNTNKKKRSEGTFWERSLEV